MAKQYTYEEDNEPKMVSEDVVVYPQGITIPITLPSTGDYSIEELKHELTSFAIKLLRRPMPSSQAVSHSKWRNITVSDEIKAMTLGPSSLSTDTRNDKELLLEALEEKYR